MNISRCFAVSCVACLTVSTADAAIQVARVLGGGNNEADEVFASGDLSGSITNVTSSTFNSLSPTQLRSSYDVLLFGWTSSPTSLDTDWNTRLLPYLQQGGGIIWENPYELADLSTAVTASIGSGSNVTVSQTVPGLTDGVTDDFVNYHITFSAWDSQLAPFLKDGTTVVGLFGEFGFQGGRIALNGPDNDYHAIRGDSGAAGNQYQLLLNELQWVSSGTVTPEPSSLLVWPLLGATLAVGLGWRRAKRRGATPQSSR